MTSEKNLRSSSLISSLFSGSLFTSVSSSFVSSSESDFYLNAVLAAGFLTSKLNKAYTFYFEETLVLVLMHERYISRHLVLVSSW